MTWLCPKCQAENRDDYHRISCRQCAALRPAMMKLEIELPFSEADEPIQWIECLQAEIVRICNENDVDPAAFVKRPE